MVMQEKVRIENGLLFIDDNEIRRGSNVRLQGTQTKVGDLVLHQGHVLCEGSVDQVQNDERVVEVYLGRKKKDKH